MQLKTFQYPVALGVSEPTLPSIQEVAFNLQFCKEERGLYQCLLLFMNRLIYKRYKNIAGSYVQELFCKNSLFFTKYFCTPGHVIFICTSYLFYFA